MFKKIIFCGKEGDKKGVIEDVKIFPEDGVSKDTLVILNKNGYNIYQTVNSFFGNIRDSKHLGEFRNIFIDLDYNEEEFKLYGGRENYIDTKYIEVYRKILLLFSEFGIFPSYINETYKGFHIIYELNKELFFITEELYFKILDFFISFFGGDIRTKDVARVFKIYGFKDNFKGRNFIIKNRLEKKKHSVDTTIGFNILNNLGLKINYDKDRLKKFGLGLDNGEINKLQISKFEEKNLKKERNFHLISQIPFSKLKDSINKYFKKEICIINENNNVIFDNKLFGGIKWNKEGDYINDFSHGILSGENRANGNKNFLLNIVFFQKFEEFIKFLNIEFNIIWNKGSDYIPQSITQSLGIIKGEYNLYEQTNNINKLILKGSDINMAHYIRYIIGLLIIINDKQYIKGIDENGDNLYVINFNDFLKKIGISSIKNGNIRNKIKEDLLRLSYLKREKYEKISTENGGVINVVSYVPLFNIGFGIGEKNSNIITVKTEKFTKVNYFNKGILNIPTKNDNLILLAYKISISCGKGKKFNFSNEKLRNELKLTIKRKDKFKEKIKKHMGLLVEYGIIKKFEFNSKDGVIIFT